VFVDAAGCVVAVERLAPWRVGRRHDGARAVLEVPRGAAGATQAGDRMAFEGPDGGASILAP
jgi:uncharacterized membrane protein (UPF0127 family)